MRACFLLLFFSLVLCVHRASAQQGGASGVTVQPPFVGAVTSTPGRFDYYPGTVNTTNISYDSAFRLAVHLQPGQLIHLATLVQVKRGQLLGELLYKNKSNICRDHTPHLESDTAKLPVWDIDFVAGDFKPGRYYSLVLYEGVGSAIFSMDGDNGLLDAYYKAVDAGNGPNAAQFLTAAKTAYSKLDDQQNNKFGYSAMDDFQAGYDFYKNSIYPIHKNFYSGFSKVNDNSNVQGIVKFSDLSEAAICLENLYERLKSDNVPCKGGPGSPCDSVCRVLSILYALEQISGDATGKKFGDFEAGRVSVEDVLKSPAEIKKAAGVQAQLSNIQLSLRDLTLVKNVLYGYGLVAEANSCLDNILDALSAALVETASDLTQLIQYKQDILNKLNSGPTINFYDVQVESLNSNILNFQTRTTLYFTPVFGYATYKFGNTYDFSPYLGFQVNFQPMNQNVKFRDIQYKTGWQRLSFVTAWTLKSVSSPGKRQDFFGNSSSLLTGIGFKLSHFVMLNASALWFKALDPNPYSTQKNIVCVPALSLSINLSVPTILNGFSTLIPSL